MKNLHPHTPQDPYILCLTASGQDPSLRTPKPEEPYNGESHTASAAMASLLIGTRGVREIYCRPVDHMKHLALVRHRRQASRAARPD